MKRRGLVAVVATATALVVVVLLFPVMGDSRGSLSMLGTPVPSENGLVAITAAIAAAGLVGVLMSSLMKRQRRERVPTSESAHRR